jgi:hypothetical protein
MPARPIINCAEIAMAVSPPRRLNTPKKRLTKTNASPPQRIQPNQRILGMTMFSRKTLFSLANQPRSIEISGAPLLSRLATKKGRGWSAQTLSMPIQSHKPLVRCNCTRPLASTLPVVKA